MKFGTPSAGTLERFRERTATGAPFSLRRKQCACGTIVTAKQLTQQGGCDECARARASERAKASA